MKVRNAKFDNLKLLLICAVVFGHLGNKFSGDSSLVGGLQFWVYLFHMPAFIFISGLFCKNTIENKRYSKAVPYLFIYLLMKVISLAVSIITKGSDSATIDLFKETGIAWFALAMFWWICVAINIKEIDYRYVLVASIAISVISGYCSEIGSFLVLQRTIVFFPFFYAGYIVDVDRLVDYTGKLYVRIGGAIAIAVSLVLALTVFGSGNPVRQLFRANTSYMNLKFQYGYSLGFMWRIIAYIVSFVLVIALVALTPNIECFLSKLGRKTLPVYVFHGTVISLAFSQIHGLKKWVIHGHTAIKCVLLTMIIVLITSIPIFEWPLKKIMDVPHRKEKSKE